MIMQNLQNELISFIVIALVVILFAYYEFKIRNCKISDNVSTCFTFMFPFFQTSFKSVKL